MNKYAGKRCPFCKTPLLESDSIVLCDTCSVPHHKECWNVNGACMTSGCKGKMCIVQGENAHPQLFARPAQQGAQPVQENKETAQPQQRAGAYCIHCGAWYQTGARFCSRCGKQTQAPSKEEQDKSRYEQALKLLESKSYAEAKRLFEQLGEYSDASDKLRLCEREIENGKNERAYRSAVACLESENPSEEQLRQAIGVLNAIPDYKDAGKKAMEIQARLEKQLAEKKAAEEAQNKEKYEAALAHLHENRFREAYTLFWQLGDYADAKAQLEKCQQASIEYQNRVLYERAQAALKAQNPSETELKNAIGVFEMLGKSQYQDAVEKLREANKRLEKYYEEKRAAEEKEKARIAAIKAKRKKIFKIVALALAGAALIVGICLFLFLPHDITYELDGGNVNTELRASYRFVSGEVVLPVPEKEGYTFLGWTGKGLETATVDAKIKACSLGKRSFVANWQANTYKLTFNADGGRVSEDTANATYDASITLPTPTKSGYTFAGWYCDGVRYDSGNWKTAGDAGLVAKWIANEYTITYADTAELVPSVTVTYHHNYPSAPTEEEELTNGEVLAYPNAPARRGYVFAGWYTDADCTTLYSFSGELTQNLALYAKWVAVVATNNSTSPWSISDGILTSTNKTDSSTSTSTITAPIAMTVSFGYRTSSESFDHLYIKKNGVTQKECSGDTSYVDYSVALQSGDQLSFVYQKDGSVNSYSDCAYIADLQYLPSTSLTSTATASCSEERSYVYCQGATVTQTVTFHEAFTLLTVTREGYALDAWYYGETKMEAQTWPYANGVTLNAGWTAGDYVIRFDADGGTISQMQMSVVYDRTYTLPTPRKTGYDFDGWYAGTTKYTNGTWKGLSNVTLKAKWTPKQYTLTYEDTKPVYENVTVTLNKNYAGATNSTVSLTNGQTFLYPAIPTRSGYVFAGWYVDSACTTAYTFTGTVTQDMTLYAKWATNQKVNVINVGASTSVSLSGTTIRYFAFVPLVSGTITVYSTSDYDTYGYLYNSSLSQLTYNDDGGSGSNFSYTYTVTAGMLYYIGVKAYHSSTTGTATLYVSGVQKPTSTATVSSSEVISYAFEADSTATQSVSYMQPYTLPTLTRTGYTFLGWCNGTTPVALTGTWSIASAVTLTPMWQGATLTLNLNPNGGTLSQSSANVTYGSTYSLPVPTRTGYDFDGWYSGDTLYAGGVWSSLSISSLIAHWSPKTLTVTFADTVKSTAVVTYNYNYSGAASALVSLQDGQKLTYPTVPTRSGYVFTGWYTDSACTERYDFTGEINAEMTLYAGWRAQYTDGVMSNSILTPFNYTSSSSAYGVSASGTSSTWRKYCYLVANESGSHKIYYKNSSSSSSYATYIYIKNLTTGSTIKTNSYCYSTTYTGVTFQCDAGDVIVISVYAYSSYYTGTAYFYFEGFASVTSTAQAQDLGYAYSVGDTTEDSITYGETFTLPEPVREGCRFLGWYYNGSRINAGTWSYDTDITLTSRWQSIVYYNVALQDTVGVAGSVTVTFDSNYSAGSDVETTVTSGDVLPIPAVPERYGFVFTGWYLDSACTQKYTFTGTINADMTLYAGWRVCSVSNSSTYPWQISNDLLYSTNKGSNSSASYTITAPVDMVVTFSYKTSSESGYDYLYIKLNGTTWGSCAGEKSYVTARISLGAGDTLSFVYSKDNSVSDGDDCAYISNLRMTSDTLTESTAEVVAYNGAAYSSGGTYTVQFAYGESYTLPTLVRSGYTFLGWYNGTTQVPLTGTWNINDNVTLTPKWA